jgi:hypothetical protein
LGVVGVVGVDGVALALIFFFSEMKKKKKCVFKGSKNQSSPNKIHSGIE